MSTDPRHNEDRWCSPHPRAARALMHGLAVPWWIAGGWAIELFVGEDTRPHDDLDLGCFRDDLPQVLARFPGWTQRILDNNIWLRPPDSACWQVELMLDDRRGSDWIYRRDNRIRYPAADISVVGEGGLPYLLPEIALLYKSKSPRPRDDQDFQAAWPLLSPEAKSWLRTSLKMTSPGHPWLVGGESE
jgi:hypothetical protein